MIVCAEEEVACRRRNAPFESVSKRPVPAQDCRTRCRAGISPGRMLRKPQWDGVRSFITEFLHRFFAHTEIAVCRRKDFAWRNGSFVNGPLQSNWLSRPPIVVPAIRGGWVRDRANSVLRNQIADVEGSRLALSEWDVLYSHPARFASTGCLRFVKNARRSSARRWSRGQSASLVRLRLLHSVIYRELFAPLVSAGHLS